MNDPERLLLGGANERERRLLEAGAQEEPPADRAARLAAALGVSGLELAPENVPAGPPAQASGLGGLDSKLTAKWLALAGAGVLAVLSGVWIASTRPRGEKSPAVESRPAPPTGAASAEGATSLEPVLAPPAAESAPAAPAAPDPVPAAAPEPLDTEGSTVPAARGAEPALPPSPSTAGEIEQLDTVRGLLQKRGLHLAFKRLDRYEASYGRGALREEAQVLRIEALSLSQQRHEAQRLAVRFLQTHPNSVHAARVRSLVEVDAGR